MAIWLAWSSLLVNLHFDKLNDEKCTHAMYGSGTNVKIASCIFCFCFVRVCVRFIFEKKNVLVEQDLLNSLKTDGEFNVYLVKNRDTRPNL